MFARFTIFPSEAAFFGDLLRDVYRFRKRVFVDGMGWPLTVHPDGGERDSFDDDNAITVVLVAGGRIRASARLNPAAQGLLTCVFGGIIEQPSGNLDTALECSRFAVAPDLTRAGQRLWSARLLWAVGMAGLSYGTTRFVSLSDPVMERVLRRIGGQPRRLGRPHRSAEGHSVLALELPGDRAAVARVAEQASLPDTYAGEMKELRDG